MIAKNIKKIREEKNITQSDLAEKMNVTVQEVADWENGTTQPDVDTLRKIADALEISTEELIYENKKTKRIVLVRNTTVAKNIDIGAGFGAALAMVISYVKWQSIGWALLHGACNWIYVIYYIIKYGWS